MKSAPAITFDYRPSRWLGAAILAMGLLAVAATTLCGLAVWEKAIVLLVVCAGAASAWRRSHASPLQRCAWYGDDRWRVRDTRGEEHQAVLLHAAVRGPLIALVLNAGALRRVALILLPDNSDAELRRRLRVRLSRSGDAAAQQVR